MHLPPYLTSRRGKIALACILVLAWVFASYRISQLSGWFFQPSLHGARGLALYLLGDYSGAAKAYRAHFREETEAGRTLGSAVSHDLARGDLQEAKQLSRSILEKDPQKRGNLLRAGEIELEAGDPAQALSLFDAVLQENPKDLDALLLSAYALTSLKDYNRAIDRFKRAFRPNSVGDWDRGFLIALQLIGELVDRPASEQPACLLAHYFRYLRIHDNGAAGKAVVYAQKAIAEGDRPDDGYVTLGVVAHKEGKTDRALTAFLKAVEANPRNAEAYRWSATVYMDRGEDLLNEYRMWKGAFEAEPDDPFYAGAYVKFLYKRLGDYPLALKVSMQNVEHWPDNVEMLVLTGEIYALLGQYEQGISYDRKVLVLDPRRADVHVRIAYGLQELRRTQEAIDEYKAALAIEPYHAQAHIGLAQVHLDAGRKKEAITEYETALNSGARDVTTRATLCTLYHFTGQYRQAADCFKIVITQDPENKMAKQLLPYTLKNLGLSQ